MRKENQTSFYFLKKLYIRSKQVLSVFILIYFNRHSLDSLPHSVDDLFKKNISGIFY